jgi:hypothetical protein
LAAASAVLATASCSDLAAPTDAVLSLEDLLILPMQAGAPQPTSAGFWVYNSRQTVQRLVHPEAQLTPYLELSFPAGALSSLKGNALTASDSVWITVDPRVGQYGFTLSPAGVVFTAEALPTARFFFGFYADASVASQSDRYSTATEFAAALDIWREITVAQWSVAANSAAAGIDAVSATVASSGEYVLAAPR